MFKSSQHLTRESCLYLCLKEPSDSHHLLITHCLQLVVAVKNGWGNRERFPHLRSSHLYSLVTLNLTITKQNILNRQLYSQLRGMKRSHFFLFWIKRLSGNTQTTSHALTFLQISSATACYFHLIPFFSHQPDWHLQHSRICKNHRVRERCWVRFQLRSFLDLMKRKESCCWRIWIFHIMRYLKSHQD